MISFGELAAVVTVVGAAIYMLGLVGLAWPIHRRWDKDASTTWYAMSLIPRAVVAGQGVRLFMGFPSILAATWVILWLIIFPITEVIQVLIGSWLVYWAVLIFLALLATAGVRWLLRQQHIQWLLGPTPDYPPNRWLTITLIALAVPMAFVAGFLAAAAIELQAGFPFVTLDLRLLLVAVILAFLAAFLLQLIDATAIEPPLPTVEIVLADGRQKVLEGKLLTHTEGVVYFFDEQHKLVSMSDSKVASVQIQQE